MKCLKHVGLPFYAVTEDGEVWSQKSNRFLKQCKTNSGYLFVNLTVDGWSKPFLVHRLVASAYLGEEKDKVVNHLDGEKTNNHFSNLEWCTYSENAHHAIRTGLKPPTKNPYRVLGDDLVHKICAMLEEGGRNKDICSALGVERHTVCAIKAGKEYKDISEEYEFRKIPSSSRVATGKVIGICKELEKGTSSSKIMKKFATSHRTVRNIKDRKAYTYLSKGFTW